MPSANNNLPRQLTSFIGREPDIAEVKRLLAQTRLLTLTGSGGSGKTRLALQVADALLDDYPDGVWLVELAALTDPALVPQATAFALSVSEQQARPLVDTLVEYLAERNLLLVLDNCEHLLETCASLADTLLRACPHLHMLATSQHVLRVGGEMTWRVPSLSLPDLKELPPFENLAQYEGIRLFMERARFKRPGFELTPQNARYVAQLCRYLDGMPLAIELAAARMSVLSLEQTLARLDARFRLLTQGMTTALERQQTLHAAVDWSYDLLSPVEQALFTELAVFAGSFSLEAMEGICGMEMDEYETISLLSNLVDKSLVIMEEREGEARYHMLETIRQYAWEKLHTSPEMPELRTRHLLWYMELAEQAKPELEGPNQKMWLDRLEMEHDNMRAALAWSQVVEDSAEENVPETCARLAVALWWFWYVRGYLSEGRRWMAAILARGNELPTHLRATALYGTGILVRSQGDNEYARALFNEALSLFRESADKQKISHTLNNLGVLATNQGDYKLAATLLKESLTLQRELGGKREIANSLGNLANIATDQGDYSLARSYLEESLAIFRQLDHERAVAIVLNNLGGVVRSQGDYETARGLIEESLAIKRELGDKIGIASSLNKLSEVEWCCRSYEQARNLIQEALSIFQEVGGKEIMALVLNNLGEVARCEGDFTTAHTLYDESLANAREYNDKWAAAAILHNLGLIALQENNYEQAQVLFRQSLQQSQELGAKVISAQSLVGIGRVAAAYAHAGTATRLLGAAQAIFETTGYRLHPNDQDEYGQRIAAMLVSLGKAAWEQAWAEGRALSLEEAVEMALRDMPPQVAPEEADKDRTDSAPQYPNDLTKREVEVLRLVAEGLSNEQVAARLFLSTHTVRAHLHSVYGKLNVNTRGAATRFALEHDLL